MLKTANGPLQAAKASTKGVDEKQVKEAFQKLVGDGVLSEASLELLEQAAGKATTTLKARCPSYFTRDGLDRLFK